MVKLRTKLASSLDHTVSEKAYWITLVIIFTSFALVVWFYLLPFGYIDSNLAANLFTSSIFMVITIIFLSWFIGIREKQEWTKVKHVTYSKINFLLQDIVDTFDSYCEPCEEERKNRETYVYYFNPFSPLESDVTLRPSLLIKDWKELQDYCTLSILQINNIVDSYSKVMHPELLYLLITLSISMGYLKKEISSLRKIGKRQSKTTKVYPCKSSLNQVIRDARNVRAEINKVDKIFFEQTLFYRGTDTKIVV
jgi:hypothetical protein